MSDVDLETPEGDSMLVRDKMMLYIDALINEVKKRPFLYDKKHEHYGNRKKVNKCWQRIAAILKRGPDEVKAKWRNLKDSFHRLEKRLEMPPKTDGKPVLSYYTGQWVHFEKLLFLRDTRQNRSTSEDFVEADVPEIYIEDIKGEFDLSEHSDDIEDRLDDKNDDSGKTFTEPLVTFQNVLSEPSITTTERLSETRKRALIDTDSENIEKKRRIIDLVPTESEIDEDLHFVKSLVPFLRKLNPVRKLIVRNEMQNLLIKEMLCDQCRSFGPQPNCRCNLS